MCVYIFVLYFHIFYKYKLKKKNYIKIIINIIRKINSIYITSKIIITIQKDSSLYLIIYIYMIKLVSSINKAQCESNR